MPHATPGRPRAQRSRHNIKPDPDLPSSTTAAPVVNHSSGNSSENSNYGGTSAYIPVDQSFYRNGRSDAPPPSERPSESEPLLKEVRIRPDMSSSESPPGEESFFHTSFQDIGKKLKASNDTLGELQQLGVSHDVPLPELVLVGDQSAGKSSLLSGLAFLDLPRSEGTCTRCPLHIRVSRTSDWSCRVWLRKDYAYEPPQDRPISERDVTDDNPFFPWTKLPVTAVQEFKTMHDKAEIEDVLRWAQIAILNDWSSHELYIPGCGTIAQSTPIAQAAERTAAKFSPNIVALEIKGPDLPDLSFYDMPGIFQNPADARDDYLVNVVRNLSKVYISHPSAIIICAMPMNSDAENSCTFSLTRRLGASNRTIGVLTKADLLTTGGNHEQWLAIMRGDAHQTGFGYFITSRPHGKELDELKRWETAVFEEGSLESWPPYFHDFEYRSGVEKLKAFLSERLGEEFAKSLPNIKHKVKHHLEKINRQLDSLPELPINVEAVIQGSLINFSDSSRQRVDEFTQSFNSLPTQFRNCLLHMKPKITLKDQSEVPVLEISDDESEAGSTAGSFTTPTGKRRGASAATTPSKRPRVAAPAGQQANASGSFSAQVKPEETRGSLPPPPPPPPHATKQLLPEPFTKFSDGGRKFRTLRQVREEIVAKTTAGMPNRIPDKVYQELAMEAVRPWKGPMDVFLKQTMHLLQKALESTLDGAFEGLKKRFIYKEAKTSLKRYLEEHRAAAAEALGYIYGDESSQLLTFNEEIFKQFEREEREILTHFRHYVRMQAASLPAQHVPWEALTEDRRAQEVRRREADAAKLGPDGFAREVDVVAYIRGYYRLAALRFADAVAQCVICRMMPRVRRQLPGYLEEKLGLRVGGGGGSGGQRDHADVRRVYERLMEEDEATAARRETLKGEKRKFETALASIEGLERDGPAEGMSGGADNGMGHGAVNGTAVHGTVSGEGSLERSVIGDADVAMSGAILDDEV